MPNGSIVANTAYGDDLSDDATGVVVDTINNFEDANGGQGQDVIYGSAAANTLFGNGDDDNLFGFGGNDRLFGGTDEDGLPGGAGDDRLFGDSDNDTLIGGAGKDELTGRGPHGCGDAFLRHRDDDRTVNATAPASAKSPARQL